MLLSLNWIKKFVDFEVVDKETLNNVVVGYVEELKKHPDADKLNVARVNIGQAESAEGKDKIIQIVCGGVNLKKGVHVAVALPGAVLPGDFKIKTAKVRGEESNGMICGIEEIKLGLSKNAREIWIFEEGNGSAKGIKKWTPGQPLIEALELNGYSPEELSSLVTIRTAEVEGVIPEGKYLDHVVTGKLLSFEKIKDTEKKIMVTHMHPKDSKAEFSGFKGSKAVKKAVQEFHPDVLITAHIHEAAGMEEKMDKTKVINVSRKEKIFEI